MSNINAIPASSLIHKKYSLLPLGILLLFTLVSQFTSFDINSENIFYDLATKHWLGENSWWANTLIHEWGRDFIVLIFISSLSLIISSYFFSNKLKKYRRIATYLCLGILLTTTIVGLGKRYSNIDCPRDLIEYGSNKPYIHLFSARPTNLASGQCFPGGHSSGAFSLFTLYFLSLLLASHHSKKVLIAICLLGLVFAFGQWARGCHFIIHDIWSAVIGWYVSLILFKFMFNDIKQE